MYEAGSKWNCPHHPDATVPAVTDPSAFGGSDAFKKETGHLVNACRTCPPAPGVDAVRVPGQRGLERKRQALAEGVALYPAIMPALEPFATKFGVTPPRPSAKPK